MYVITITNIDHNLLEVEVSVDVYKVYEDSRRQEERQRYERRKHIDGRSFDNCLLFELATEPLEQTYERIERLREIQAVLQDIPPQQRERFILHFVYGYSYSEIAKMQGCHKAAVMRSAKSALKKSVKIWLPDYQLLPVFSPNHAVFLLYKIYYRLLLRRSAHLLR